VRKPTASPVARASPSCTPPVTGSLRARTDTSHECLPCLRMYPGILHLRTHQVYSRRHPCGPCPPVPPRDHLAGKDAEGLAVLAPVDSVVVSALDDSFGNFMGRGPRIPPRFWRRNIPVPPMHDAGSPGLQVYTPPVEFSPFPTVRHSSVTLHREVQVRRFPNHVLRPIQFRRRHALLRRTLEVVPRPLQEGK
jgi:hypothetical protein